jgi:hypothetical protein
VRKRTTTRPVARWQWQQGLVRKRTTTHRIAQRQQQQNRGNEDYKVVNEASHSRCVARHFHIVLHKGDDDNINR